MLKLNFINVIYKNGLSVSMNFSNLSDDEIKKKMGEIKKKHNVLTAYASTLRDY